MAGGGSEPHQRTSPPRSACSRSARIPLELIKAPLPLFELLLLRDQRVLRRAERLLAFA